MKRLATILTLASTLLAATPALAGGWYLMQAPTDEVKVMSLHNWWQYWTQQITVPNKDIDLYQRTDYEAPLSKWVQLGEGYETLAQCQQDEYREHQQALNDELSHQNDRIIGRTHEQEVADSNRINFDGLLESSKCVFAGDPRLAR